MVNRTAKYLNETRSCTSAVFILRTPNERQVITGGAASTLLILSNLRWTRPTIFVNQRDAFTNRLEAMELPTIMAPPYPEREKGGKRYLLGLCRGLRTLRFLWGMRRLLRGRFDVLSCDEIAAPFVVPAARIAGVPTVVYIRNNFRNGRIRKPIRIALQDASRIAVLSHQMLDDLWREAPRAARNACLVRNGVDLQEVQQLRERTTRSDARRTLGIPIRSVAVGVIGAIEPRKNQLELLKAAATEPLERKDVILYIIGGVKDKQYAVRCNEVAAQVDGIRVSFVGHTNDLPLWYRGLDMVVLASVREGVPRVLFEAGAYGLPTVALDIPGCDEAVVDGETGILCENVTKAWRAACRLSMDEVLRHRLGSAAAAHVQMNFNAVANAEQYEQLLLEAAGCTPAER